MEIGLIKNFESCKKAKFSAKIFFSQKIRNFHKKISPIRWTSHFYSKAFFGLGGGGIYILTLLETVKLKLKGMPKLNKFYDKIMNKFKNLNFLSGVQCELFSLFRHLEEENIRISTK